MNIKGVAFDLEGTCVNVERAHHDASILVAREVGVDLDFDSALRQIPGFIGGGSLAIARGIWELSDKRKSVAELVSAKETHYERILAEMDIVPRPGVMACIDLILQMGLPIAIGSLTKRKYAQVLLRESGLGEVFGDDMIVLREDVEHPKPAPDVFLETASRMGIPSSEQLVFEDSTTGVRAAVAAGSRVMALPVYKRPDVIQELVGAGASRVFMGWHEVNVRTLVGNVKGD